MTAKCLSFALDLMHNEVPRSDGKLAELVKVFGFCLYPPNARGGPLLTFKKYHDAVRHCQSGVNSDLPQGVYP